MIPLGDDQGKLRFTPVTLLLLSTIVATFVCQWPLEVERCDEFTRRYGMIPREVLAALQGQGKQHFVMDGIVPVFTYGFLHNGPIHAFSCAVALWAFGMRLEARTSWWRFGVYYVLCLLLAAATQLHFAHDAPYDDRGIVRVGSTGPVGATAITYCVLYFKARLRILVLPVPLIVAVPPLIALAVFVALQFHKVQQFAGLSCGVAIHYWPALATMGIGGFLMGPLLLGWQTAKSTS